MQVGNLSPPHLEHLRKGFSLFDQDHTGGQGSLSQKELASCLLSCIPRSDGVRSGGRARPW